MGEIEKEYATKNDEHPSGELPDDHGEQELVGGEDNNIPCSGI